MDGIIPPDPIAGGDSNALPGVPPRPKRGGKRPGAGRPKQRPAPQDPDERFDIARHVDPRTEAPVWTAELVDGFVRAYFMTHGSMRAACAKTGVPYRAALAYRDGNPDFADRLQMADQAHLDVLYEEHQRRSLEDPNRPASLIFELKSRHKSYAPASGNHTVKINVAFVDKTFGQAQVIEVAPERPQLTDGQ